MVSANKINLITGQSISITSFLNFFVSYMHIIFWLFWLLKLQDTFMVVSQKITITDWLMSSFKSWKLFKFKYVILLLTITLYIIFKKYVNNTWIIVICVQVPQIFVFHLCFKTGGCKVGKLHLLHAFCKENGCHFSHSKAGKKTFNNEHESKSYDFFESSVI